MIEWKEKRGGGGGAIKILKKIRKGERMKADEWKKTKRERI